MTKDEAITIMQKTLTVLPADGSALATREDLQSVIDFLQAYEEFDIKIEVDQSDRCSGCNRLFGEQTETDGLYETSTPKISILCKVCNQHRIL